MGERTSCLDLHHSHKANGEAHASSEGHARPEHEGDELVCVVHNNLCFEEHYQWKEEH
jgi:hypothetical protein